MDFDQEKEHVKALYGIGEQRTDELGKKCLLTRRLVERGVRFIQIYSEATITTPTGMPTATS